LSKHHMWHDRIQTAPLAGNNIFCICMCWKLEHGHGSLGICRNGAKQALLSNNSLLSFFISRLLASWEFQSSSDVVNSRFHEHHLLRQYH